MPKIRKEGPVSQVTYADPDVPDHPSSAQAELEHGDQLVRPDSTSADSTADTDESASPAAESETGSIADPAPARSARRGR